MRKLALFVLFVIPVVLYGQSKSVNKFRSDFKENSNLFFYSSTLKMLNKENNPEFAEILNGIEEIRVLNYQKTEKKFDNQDIALLKNHLKDELYNMIMSLNESGNSVNVYVHEKKGRTNGIVAIVENKENLVLIDLIGSIDVKKFMQLKQKLDNQTIIHPVS